MKKFIILVFVSVFILGCSTTTTMTSKDEIEPLSIESGLRHPENIEPENTKPEIAQPPNTTESESMEIKTIAAVPMTAPSQNAEALTAYTTGSQFLTENRLNEAEEYLKKAIELDPLFVDAMDHLGMVYRRQNRLSEAEEMYLRSISINSKNKVPYQNLAVVYRLQNRLNDAFEMYLKMVDIDPDDPESYYGIGELFFMVGDYTNSMAFFDMAIELYLSVNSPYVYDAYYYMGMMFFRMNNHEQALRYLEEARKGNPNNATIENTINEIRNTRL